MATRFLCWVALCLLGVGESPEIKNLQFVHIPSSVYIYVPYPVPKLSSSREPTCAGVTQTPRHKVTNRGQGVTLTCEPISGHRNLYCYRQTSVKGLEFLISFSYAKPLDETGLPNKRFSAEMPNGSFSTLKIQPTEPQDSVVYLCASSSATALHSHPLPVQKPPASPSLISPQVS